MIRPKSSENSPRFVTFSSKKLPEVVITNTKAEEIPALFQRVMRLELPGFVIRQCGTSADEAHTALFPLLGAVTASFSRKWDFTDVDDSGLHIDGPFVDKGWTQFTFHFTQQGAIEASLFAPSSFAIKDRQEGKSLILPIKNLNDNYQQDLIDPTLLVPVAHTATLYPGDAILFTDAWHAHDFRSVQIPRLSYARAFGGLSN